MRTIPLQSENKKAKHVPRPRPVFYFSSDSDSDDPVEVVHLPAPVEVDNVEVDYLPAAPDENIDLADDNHEYVDLPDDNPGAAFGDEVEEDVENDHVDELELNDENLVVPHANIVQQPADAVLQVDQMIERLERLQPDEDQLQPVPQRASALRAMQGIRQANRGEPKVIPQIDGAYTPSTSANVSLDNQQADDLGGTVHPPASAEAGPVTCHQNGTGGSVSAVGRVDSLGGEEPPGTNTVRTDDDSHSSTSSLDWDHHTSTSDLSPDLLEDAFYLRPLDLAYSGQSGANLDRVFNFDNALPIESTPRQARKSSSSTDRSRKNDKKKKKNLENKTKQKPSRLFKLWKKRKKSTRRDHDDDEPPGQVV